MSKMRLVVEPSRFFTVDRAAKRSVGNEELGRREIVAGKQDHLGCCASLSDRSDCCLDAGSPCGDVRNYNGISRY